MKYQFCIRFKDIDVNSAATKAVLDCNEILSRNGYTDYTFTVGDNSNKLAYYIALFKELMAFFLSVKANSIVFIQYPLLSINAVFKYFIKAARVKGVKFHCIIHDIESLRNGRQDEAQVRAEVENLNFYDLIIAHNASMIEWLKTAGVKSRMIPLEIFDYLLSDEVLPAPTSGQGIAYAGNLRKSTFIYSVSEIEGQQFTVYGPGFDTIEASKNKNLDWGGEFGPEIIPQKLNGKFGLIWDGGRIDSCDEILGNYLRYNNPHKCSLYIAAGLPLIAPEDSAIGRFIKEHNIGVLINNLFDLESFAIDANEYELMRKNVLAVRGKIIGGSYLKEALALSELDYASN